MKIHKYFDFSDFGFSFRIYKTNTFCNYNFIIDIQIIFLNIWIETFKKK